jgi:hypothetical protein
MQRNVKVDTLLDGYRKEMTRQIDEVSAAAPSRKRKASACKIERDAINKSLASCAAASTCCLLERDIGAAIEEESCVNRMISELQLKVGDSTSTDERNRAVTVLDEGRRQDEAHHRAANRDRRPAQTHWRRPRQSRDGGRPRAPHRRPPGRGACGRKRAQGRPVTVAGSPGCRPDRRDRAWIDLKSHTEASLKSLEDYARRVDQYADAFRDMRRIVEEARQMVDLVERRVIESAEVHRLSEERFRQDWASFLADDQKRWTTHMLLRDEQWREHDRNSVKQVEQVAELEERLAEVGVTIRQLQALDAGRMQTLLNRGARVGRSTTPACQSVSAGWLSALRPFIRVTLRPMQLNNLALRYDHLEVRRRPRDARRFRATAASAPRLGSPQPLGQHRRHA